MGETTHGLPPPPNKTVHAFGVLNIGNNGTICRQIKYINYTIGNAIGTNSTNVVNVWQQMTQTEYSVGKSTNAGKVT